MENDGGQALLVRRSRQAKEDRVQTKSMIRFESALLGRRAGWVANGRPMRQFRLPER